MNRVQTGLDLLVRRGARLPGRRAALLANATTVSADWVPSAEAVAGIRGLELDRILAPQHGFAAEKQDNMVESPHGTHPALGVPVLSLYGAEREPTPEMLTGVDVLLIDLQDVGTRVYTFLVTALLALRAAVAAGIPVLVLDRPNPIGGAVAGPVLDPACASFVGLIDVPLRHGLTAAECCLYGAWRLGCSDESAGARAVAAARRIAGGEGAIAITEAVSAVPMAGWRRDRYFEATGLPWTTPSPNMPAVETAVVYPGQVLLEGTNLSEGRGTTRPFEIFGAPFIEPAALSAALSADDVAGALLRPLAFEPTFQKHAGTLCRGFQIHVQDRARFDPVRLTTAILCAARRSEEFAWRRDPYEYELERPAIDLLYGSAGVRQAIDAGAAAADISVGWEPDLKAFRARRQPFLLYDA